MTTMTMADALKLVASMDQAGLARVYKRVVGAKPPRGTKLETLKDALFDALKEQTTMEGEVEVLNDSAAKWLAEGDGKRVEPKPAAVPAKVKQEKPIKLPKQAKTPKERDSRLPEVGTTITKVWRDRTLEVKCVENGFEFEGKTFKSLSKIASELQGCSSNGFLFFGLTAGAKAAAARRVEREATKEAEAPKPVVEVPKPEKPAKKAKQAKGKGSKKKASKK